MLTFVMVTILKQGEKDSVEEEAMKIPTGGRGKGKKAS